MADPTLNNLETKAGDVASSVVSHNSGWFAANKWWLLGIYVAFVVGLVVGH